MNGKNILIGIVGILVGFIGGFILANSINRNAPANTAPNQAAVNAPFGNQQVQGQTVTAQMPDVTEALDRAKNEPNNFEAQMKVGDMYAKINRFDKAAEFFAAANRIKPDDFQTLVKLGTASLENNDPQEAEKWYGKALEIKPDDVNVRSDFGLSFYKRQPPDLERAIKEYNAALAIDPNHEITLQNLTVALLGKKDAGAMETMLARLEKVNPQNSVVPKLKQELELLKNTQ